jgi:peptidoglycan-N-acetylglucosamine deacetylase
VRAAKVGAVRGRRSLILVGAAALVLVVAVAIAALATNTGGAGRVPAGPAGHDRGAFSRRQSTTGRGGQDGAIGAVLRYTPFVSAGSRRRRVIALSFDDGPGPYTEGIVRTLVRLHVPATFFIVGQQLRYFAAGLRDELAHGFEVGDHTQNHALLTRLSPLGQYEQIQGAATGIERLGAPPPHLFRPPYGLYNAHTLATLRRLDMLMVLWSIDPGDWRRPGVKAIVRGVLSAARPGAIVILHDGGGDRSETRAALPAIVRGLRRRHYQLVTMAHLLTVDPPPRRQRPPRSPGA